MLVLAVIGGCWLASAAVAQTLRNASFEDKSEADDRALGWERWGHWMNRECGWTPVKDGTCIIGYHHWEIESGDNSGLYQDVSGAKAGARYTFTIQANVDPAKEGLQSPVAVELRLESTINGEQVTLQSASYQLNEIATGDQWSPLTVSGTAASDSLRVLVVVYPAQQGPRGGAVKFDAAGISSR